ncbi:MAG TPA: 3D domain-containing protein [Thermoanaerobaculia bacterium]
MTKRLFLLSLLLLAAVSISAETVTVSIDCWQGGHCAMPCGGSGQGNYACSDGSGQWFSGCRYDENLPTAAIVKKITAKIFSHPCNSAVVTATMNGQTIGTVNETRTSCGCLSTSCIETVIASQEYPDGFPGYIPGEPNVFGINVGSGTLCVEHVELTFEYTGKQVLITADEPTIVQNSNAVNNCVQYESDLSAYATDGNTRQAGVSVRFTSNRNGSGGNPDTITQRSTVTNNAGEVTGLLRTRRPGDLTVSAEVSDGYTAEQHRTNFTEADYENQFRMTAYIIALESDFGGGTVTDPCGLTGTFNDDFLYSNRGVLMQGSGQTNGGAYVTIDWNRSRRPFNRRNLCFTTINCPTTASGQCLQPNVSIAVDTEKIPMFSNVNIQNVGNRTAHDTGDRIQNYHIDVFAGLGRAAVANWGNFNGTVRYLGGARCTN